MPNPYTFVNWGVLGVTDKAAGTSQTPLQPGYKISIWEENPPGGAYPVWASTLWGAWGAIKRTSTHKNKKQLGYATPTQARNFFNNIVGQIERHNAVTPLKVDKIRFLKKLSIEPDWRKMEVGALAYSWYLKGRGRAHWQRNKNRRVIIYFKPYYPPKPRTPKVVKPFEQRVAELNYSHYGL